jgi:hypothetical protein
VQTHTHKPVLTFCMLHRAVTLLEAKILVGDSDDDNDDDNDNDDEEEGEKEEGEKEEEGEGGNDVAYRLFCASMPDLNDTNREIVGKRICYYDKDSTCIESLGIQKEDLIEGSIAFDAVMKDKQGSWCTKCKRIKEKGGFGSAVNNPKLENRNSRREHRIAWGMHNGCNNSCKECQIKQTNKSRDKRSDAKTILQNVEKRIKRQGLKGEVISFDLPLEYVEFLLKESEYICPYLGIKMQRHKDRKQDGSSVFRTGKGFHKDSLSIDRLIPEKGYVIGNVVLCCQMANTLKWTYKAEEFLALRVLKKFGEQILKVVKNVENQTHRWNMMQ